MQNKIEYIERKSGEKIVENVPGGRSLNWLYNTTLGKVTLDMLVKRKFASEIYGFLMDLPISKHMIDNFCYNQEIDLSQFVVPKFGFQTFNDFFYRKIKPENRPICESIDEIASPADGKILVYSDVADREYYSLKGLQFSLDELVDKKLPESFTHGSMAIIRLCPADYHRYHFPCSGKAGKSTLVDGDYYSVSPLALREKLSLFCANKREYCHITSKEFGDVIMMEVGASMVGGIINTYRRNSEVAKGSEKGYFKFGGSTVVLLFEENKVIFDDDIIENTKNGIETSVVMGEKIGVKCK
jgi:phosphatidylserine decarboxylase